MVAIGFDIGTSSLKTLVLSEDQTVIFEKSYSYAFDEPEEGYREIDPSIWFDAVIKGFKEAIECIGKEEEIVVGVTGQMHTTVFLDQGGIPVCPAIMWNDLRTVDEVPPLKEELSQYEETKYISRILSPGSPAINTLWLKKNNPDLFCRVCHIMTPYDYIVHCLTGAYGLDYCDASTSSLYDIQTKKWSKIMMDKCGVSEDVLGTVYPSCHVIGEILPEICNQLGLEIKPKVIVGTGDNPANAVSLDLMEHKAPVISLGTSGVILIAKEDGDFEGKGKNVLFSALGDSVVNIVQGTVRSAGGAQKWWVEKGVLTKDFSIDQDSIQTQDLGNNGVLFFPHITGDKLIYSDLDIRGAFIGLSANTERKDMTQAVLEGVGYALREVMENMGLKEWPQSVQINGGGTKSDLWMRILSSILNVRLDVVSKKASPCYGVCLLALQSQIPVKPVEEEVQETYEPECELVKKYNEGYRKYKKVYNALKSIA